MSLVFLFYSQMLEESPNAKLSKTVLDRYTSLPLPDGTVIATYIWIDGTGEGVRCKDRTLDFIPNEPKGESFDLGIIESVFIAVV